MPSWLAGYQTERRPTEGNETVGRNRRKANGQRGEKKIRGGQGGRANLTPSAAPVRGRSTLKAKAEVKRVFPALAATLCLNHLARPTRRARV